MEKKLYSNYKIIKEEKLFDNVLYQEFFTSKGVFVERYSLIDTKTSLEILLFVGLNILPTTRYFGHFPFNLCKETNANVSVVYELGCSSIINRHFRRFTQQEAEEQYLAGFEIVRGLNKKVIIFSHSAATIEHLKLIFNDKYKNFGEGIEIIGGIISGSVTSVLQELKRIWPNYSILNWKNIMKLGCYLSLPLPIYPYFNKDIHARYSSMNNLSIWIHSKTSEFLLSTNIKKIILNGKNPGYPLLVIIGKHDSLFSPKRQETLAKLMARRAKVNMVRCDTEHNLFLSNSAHRVLDSIKEYISKILHK